MHARFQLLDKLTVADGERHGHGNQRKPREVARNADAKLIDIAEQQKVHKEDLERILPEEVKETVDPIERPDPAVQ